MAHVHHHHVARAPVIAQWHEHNLAQLANGLVETVVSVIYVTADASSTGQQATQSATNTVANASTDQPKSSTTLTVYYATSTDSTTSSESTSVTSASDTSTISTTPTPSTSFASSVVASAGVGISSSVAIALPASTSATVSNATNQGLSGGAKAGLTIGVLAVIAIMAALVMFFVRRNRHAAAEQHRRMDDEKDAVREKRNSIASRVSVHHSKTDAPRLSLRPLTQMFMPTSEKQDVAVVTAGPNPFADQVGEKHVIAAPAAAAVAPPISSSASERTLSDLSDRSGSSEGQAFPSAVAGSRRNSPPGPGPNNVHRVQLDFKPSMEDELELRAGSLVRLLHEYDDGWALCVRLDRSQQGVVPRTCVSKLPVKPRSGPPPTARGPPSQARRGSRPPSAGPPRGPPGSNRVRSQSNAPHQQHGSQQRRPRSNSEADSPSGPVDASLATEVSRTPNLATTPIRKPVPGQAC